MLPISYTSPLPKKSEHRSNALLKPATLRRSHLRSLRSPCPRLELAGDAAGHAHADSCWFCSNLILPVHRHQELTLRKKDTRTAGFCRCAFLSGGSDRTRHP